MSDPEEDALLDQITEKAAGPAAASGDQGSFTEHSIDQLIRLDQYKRSLAASRTGGGIKFKKIVSPGADGC
mgnify:CR=1 FL=1